MAIVNRDKDVSEQKEIVNANFQLAATGLTKAIAQVPWPCEVRDVYITARALSGTPTCRVDVHRFTAGTGFAANISMMAALTYAAFGTSGALRASLAAAGSSFVQLAAGDVLVATTAGANSAADDVIITVVAKKLQDIVATFGVQN